MVGMKNRILVSGGKKQLRLVCHFTRQELWKCIGFIILEVTYGMKGHNIWSEITRTFGKKRPTKLHRDVCGNKDIHKICCVLYHPYYCYAHH